MGTIDYPPTDLIKKSFDRAAPIYNQHAQIQKNIGLLLLENLQYFIPGSIPMAADFGCGTGISTEQLQSKINIKNIYGIDISPISLCLAQTATDAKWIEADFSHPIFSQNYLDLAFSNMAFQWSTDLLSLFKLIFNQIKPKGLFAFSMPVEGTFDALKSEYKNHFYSLKNIRNFLELSGFSLQYFNQKCFTQDFKNAYSALKAIKNTGANTLLKNQYSKMAPSSFGLSHPKNLNHFFIQNNFSLEYQIGIFIAEKK